MPAPTDASPKGKKHFALKFISGKYQGEEFPIASEREIFIGRATDLDVVLVEDMVSRKHAKISFAGDVLTIEDLGSTNGTFVNGEKVRRARLKEGDRVLIGTSIVRIALTEAAAGGDAAREAEARAERAAEAEADRRRAEAAALLAAQQAAAAAPAAGSAPVAATSRPHSSGPRPARPRPSGGGGGGGGGSEFGDLGL